MVDQQPKTESGRAVVSADDGGARLDAWLAGLRPDEPRAEWQRRIRGGHVFVDGKTVRASHRLKAGETVCWRAPASSTPELVPEDIPLDILYEDDDLIALNKPPGLVVHPAPGHVHGTLVHALLYRWPGIKAAGTEHRPGIVHRLDRDTSGVLVVARTLTARDALVATFKSGNADKRYLALVRGTPVPASGTLRTTLGRHPTQRKKMAVDPPRGKDAVTHYRTLDSLAHVSLVECRIETGRTHQIRVHLAHLGHPVLGDRVYGGKPPKSLPAPDRQMLHAARLALPHPRTGTRMVFEAPVPGDMEHMIRTLRSPGTE
ncbi:RluA family pseudouridine synthase [Kiritimatiella glycovorans]|uniref:Pseudouridine synthase n=1 Tax=Kiritimatiella glycovorans TaxID=1307763 RepID=A0A0G3EGI2_9BACT|nr:RluA family pseudouridine synthase [Kiritimatiella glycovorans]AKJ64522.1 Ribosomal large subunit pseudouridine synthase D [Kiritimatiella glycovorans]